MRNKRRELGHQCDRQQAIKDLSQLCQGEEKDIWIVFMLARSDGASTPNCSVKSVKCAVKILKILWIAPVHLW